MTAPSPSRVPEPTAPRALLSRLAGALLDEQPTAQPRDAERWLHGRWQAQTRPRWCSRFAAYCPVPGANTTDYAARVLDMGPHGTALAGIRFHRLDAHRPFVLVEVWHRPVSATAEGFCAALAAAFSVFAPPEAHLFAAADPGLPGAKAARTVLAAPLARLRQRPAPAALGRVTLTPAPAVTRTEELLIALYEAFYDRRPDLRDRVTPASTALLRECAALGALWWVEVDGERAGLLGLRRQDFRGLPGVEVVEEILAPAWWGQGLGPALQRRAFDHLSTDGSVCVWGTIDADNTASERTALRTGRRPLGAWWTVPLGTPYN